MVVAGDGKGGKCWRVTCQAWAWVRSRGGLRGGKGDRAEGRLGWRSGRDRLPRLGFAGRYREWRAEDTGGLAAIYPHPLSSAEA